MKLTFQKEYISIKKFDSIDLPNFVVLTGVNGSGKSHLLEAIENRSVSLEGEGNPKVVLFDYKNFFLENEAAYNARQISEERNNAWSFLQSNARNQIESYRKNLGTDYEKLVEISKAKDKGFLNLTKEDIEDENLFVKYKDYKINTRNFISQDSFKNNQQAQSIFPIAYSTPYSLDELPRDIFDDIYKPYQFKNDFLPQQLGKVIWDYYIKYRGNEINEYQNEKHGKSYRVLTEPEFVKIHGQKPWEVINSILQRFGTIEYRLPSPEGSDYYSDFQFRLEHPTKSLRIDFSALSSGEKVLMALVASIYKMSSDHHFPDILLLDEIDASLHPSMIKNLLETINEIFLKNDTKVILVTHSPTTIALAPEESVYVMNKEGLNRVEKRSKSDALNILTEGFATLEEGLRIFDEISKQNVSIISEGRNVSYIKKALDLNSIKDADVITGVEGTSGDTQLRTIFEFLCKIPHQKKVIIVWDSDVQHNFTASNNTYPFIFSKNVTNKLAEKGIENLFGEALFNDFITTVNDSRGNERKTFDTSRKKDFENYILNRNNKDDFGNFNELILKIQEVTSH
jgi:predicted ATPase